HATSTLFPYTTLFRSIKSAPNIFKPDSQTTFFGASFAAGFFTALASSPVDVIKNRLMSQPSVAPGQPRLYSGMVDCAVKSVKKRSEERRGGKGGSWWG